MENSDYLSQRAEGVYLMLDELLARKAYLARVLGETLCLLLLGYFPHSRRVFVSNVALPSCMQPGWLNSERVRCRGLMGIRIFFVIVSIL